MPGLTGYARGESRLFILARLFPGIRPQKYKSQKPFELLMTRLPTDILPIPGSPHSGRNWLAVCAKNRGTNPPVKMAC